MAATETQQGVAKIFAMDGATMVVLTGAATITMADADWTHDFELAELKGQNGETETIVASDPKYNVTINFAPNGATRALAITSAANSIAAPITKVVLSGFSIAAFNGNYNTMPGQSINMRSVATESATMRIPLRAYITNRTSLTAGLISG